MNQFEFDSIGIERLEIYISCQTESTELEKMLVKKLVDLDRDLAYEVGESSNYESRVSSLEDAVESFEETIAEIEELANGDDAEEAIAGILKIV